jgi:hypothetical protein
MVTINDLLEIELGAPTRPVINPVLSQVGTAELQVLRNNPNRIQFILVNLSANAMFILPQPGVSSSNGIRIPPSGGSGSFWWKEDAAVVSWDWYVVASASSSNLLVIESVTN